MNFINPYEVLELDTPDNSEVKKAKRKKLTEFELSDDGTIEFKNIKIHKADFLKATDDLDNEQKSQFYWSIKNNPELSNFLSSGDTWFFANYQTQRIFSNPDFIEFVSPYFAYQYNKVLFQTFESKNVSLLKKLSANPILVSPSQTDKAYQSLREFLNTQIQDLNQTKTDIENEESHYEEDNADEVFTDLQGQINVNLCNILPSYFQSQRNDIAQKLRNISVAVFNNLNSSEGSLQIIQYALQLSINNLTKQNLEKDYNQIIEIHKERAEAEKYAPLLLKYALVIRQLHELIQKVKDKLHLTSSIHALGGKEIKLKGLTKIGQDLPVISNTTFLTSLLNDLINIDDLNKQPDIFNEIREQIALAIRALSVEVFNVNNDLETAISLIKTAQKINVSDGETKQRIKEAAKDLNEIKIKREANEKNEISKLIEIFSDINSQIKSHGMLNINSSKLKELIENLITDKLVSYLSGFSDFTAKRKLFNELKNILVKLDPFFSNKILHRIKPMGLNDGILAVEIEKSISGYSFVAKNISSNIATGVGKTIKASNNTVGPQITGWLIFLAIFLFIGLILSLFGVK